MNKSLAFLVGFCIFICVFFIVSVEVTKGIPTARAVMGGIGIVCYFVAMNFAPKPDYKKETKLQKFVFGLEILMLILAFLVLMTMMGMIEAALVEAGYLSPDVLHYVPDSP
jgi:hypothetical protein